MKGTYVARNSAETNTGSQSLNLLDQCDRYRAMDDSKDAVTTSVTVIESMRSQWHVTTSVAVIRSMRSQLHVRIMADTCSD